MSKSTHEVKQAIRPQLKRKASEEVMSKELRVVSHNVHTLIPLLQALAQPALSFSLKGQPQSSSSSDSDASPVNGRKLPWNPVTALIRDHDPHIICLQEIKPSAPDADLRRALSQVTERKNTGLSKQEHTYTPHASLSHAKKGRNFGVVTFVRDDVEVVGVREVDWDKEGRVVVVELEGLAVYNVYALNGSEYSWTDPATGRVEGTRNERKRRFNHLLMQDVQRQKLNPRTPDVLLIGDFNISLTALDCYPRLRTEYPHNIARAQFKDEIIPGMGVLDVYREKYGKVKAYSWFAVGKPYRSDCARVDFALATKVVCDAVEKMEYLERSCGQSDHCPLLITLDLSKLDRVAGRDVDGDNKRSKMG